jgi:predicted nucleic-acid-binding Zn-ribbon protein
MKDSRLYIILLMVFLMACTNNTDEELDSTGEVYYKVIEIEACQYVVVERGLRLANNYSFSITHKGNCKNHPK